MTGVSQEDGRRRREENVYAIRKDKKEEGLSKRRNIREEVETVATETTLQTLGASGGVKRAYTAADIPALKAGLQSADITVQEESLRGFRRLLSLEKESPVRQCIDSGAVPLIVEFLLRNDSTDLQFEAAWVLTNIASSSDETAIIAECGAIPHLVNLLLSPNADIREQVMHNHSVYHSLLLVVYFLTLTNITPHNLSSIHFYYSAHGVLEMLLVTAPNYVMSFCPTTPSPHSYKTYRSPRQYLS